MLYRMAFKAAAFATRYLLTSVLMKEAVGMVPPETRAKIAEGFDKLKDKSQQGMVALLEKHAPGMVDNLVKRNGGKQLDQGQLADVVKAVMAAQKEADAAPAPTATPAKKSPAKKKSAPVT